MLDLIECSNLVRLSIRQYQMEKSSKKLFDYRLIGEVFLSVQNLNECDLECIEPILGKAEIGHFQLSKVLNLNFRS